MSLLEGKKIAILGGTGTLGRALVKEIIELYGDVSEIIIYSRDEIKQLEMMDDFSEESNPKITYYLGDVRDADRLNEVIKGMDFVIHGAAIKHVVMAEKNPEECQKTNVIGTKNVIQACLDNQVKKSLFISTDKANNPIGVYGKSKQIAETEWLMANAKSQCQFNVVRLGNIIGARGSVFESFERQRETGVIKVTHPDATRFCISKEQAAQFILNGLFTDAKGVLIPEMESFSIIELAHAIAPECSIEIIGLRPGDKLHEEVNGRLSSEALEKLVYGT